MGGAIESALERVATDNRLRGELIENGLARAKLFNWHRCAEATVAAYDRVLAA